jgi:hypothetical protein
VSVILTWPTPKITIFGVGYYYTADTKNIGIGCIKISDTNNIAPINRPVSAPVMNIIGSQLRQREDEHG